MSDDFDFEALSQQMRKRALEITRDVLKVAQPRGDSAGGYCAAPTTELVSVVSGLGTALGHAIKTFSEAGAIDDVTASQLFRRVETVTLDAQAAILSGSGKPRIRPEDLN